MVEHGLHTRTFKVQLDLPSCLLRTSVLLSHLQFWHKYAHRPPTTSSGCQHWPACFLQAAIRCPCVTLLSNLGSCRTYCMSIQYYTYRCLVTTAQQNFAQSMLKPYWQSFAASLGPSSSSALTISAISESQPFPRGMLPLGLLLGLGQAGTCVSNDVEPFILQVSTGDTCFWLGWLSLVWNKFDQSQSVSLARKRLPAGTQINNVLVLALPRLYTSTLLMTYMTSYAHMHRRQGISSIQAT